MGTLSPSPRGPQWLTPEERKLREMPLDEFIHWMIDHGRYDVDTRTGQVTNCRTGKVLKPTTSGQRRNYRKVGLAFSARLTRLVAVHRMVAVKLWGVAAIAGKEVGHLDSDPANNRGDNLWLPESNAEHDEFDDSTRGLIPAPRKTSWPPCSECGTPDGAKQADCLAPIRLSGLRFGRSGVLCRKCYHRLAERERRAKGGAS